MMERYFKPYVEAPMIPAGDGDYVLYDDVQAALAAKDARIQELEDERNAALNGNPLALDLAKQLAARDARIRELVMFYDKHVGTPCEQIRHQQELEAKEAELARVKATPM